jgi:hypothetical protein
MVPKLLNLGDQSIRDELKKGLGNMFLENQTTYKLEGSVLGGRQLAKYLMDPDNQYSGGSSNKILHTEIRNLVGTCTDGTFIETTDDMPEDLQGASEIVLWRPSSLLIQNS